MSQSQLNQSEKQKLTLADLPGPRSYPLIGNLLQFDRKRIHCSMEQWADEYGDIFLFKFGPQSMVGIADPELQKTILRSRPQQFRRIKNLQTVIGDMGITGVFDAEGESWKRQRRMISPIFNKVSIKNFLPILTEITERLYEVCKETTTTDSAVDIRQHLMRYTVDTTVNLAFGHPLNSLQHTGDKLQENIDKIFPMISRRIQAPFPYWRYVKFADDKALDKAVEYVNKRSLELISETKEKMQQDPSRYQTPSNLLEAMIAAKDDDDSTFSEEELFGNIIIILLAGEDTTANTLAWMIFYLIENPNIQEKLRQEILNVESQHSDKTEFEILSELHYVEAAIRETLRLKSIAPFLFMEPNEDVVLAGYEIPKGQPLALLTRKGGFNESNYPESQKFDPDRWFENKETSSCPHRADNHFPFGAGPRVCPGEQLAILEMKMVMRMMCKNFNIVAAQSEKPVEEVYAFTVFPENLSVKLIPITNDD